jgi:hypothetical protein
MARCLRCKAGNEWIEGNVPRTTERDAERFRYLQNIGKVQAQAYFWNYSSRKQRAQAIDADIAQQSVTIASQQQPSPVDSTEEKSVRG